MIFLKNYWQRSENNKPQTTAGIPPQSSSLILLQTVGTAFLAG
jgi:hypothetical protein